MKYISDIITYLLDFLLPKTAEVVSLEKMRPFELTQKLASSSDARALFNYQDPLCRQAIWEIKFRGNQTLIRNFSLLLYDFILEALPDLQNFHNFKDIILVPAPSSKSHLRTKGFNQCVLICEELVRIDKERNQNTFTFIPNLLVKKVDTERQVKVKNRKTRLENLNGSFVAHLPSSNHSYILIDDVITTGATMNEADRALKKAGAQRVIGFSLAH